MNTTTESSPTLDTSWQPIPALSIQLQPPAPVEWDVENLLQSDDGPACWFGDSGSYKSFLALHVAWCMSTGEAVFGKFATKKRDRVTYINIDAGKNSFERRVCRLPKANASLYVVSPDGWISEEFERLVADNPGSFNVVDCFTDMYDQPANVDMAHHMRQTIKYFRDIFANCGASGIVIDHSKRAQSGSPRGVDSYYGSAQKKATWRQMVQIEKVTLDKFVPGHARVKFTCVKMSEGEEFPPFFVDLTFSNGIYSCEYAGLATGEAEEASRTQTLRDEIVGHLQTTRPNTKKAAEIAECLGANRNSRAFTDALRAAVKSGRVNQVGNGRSTRYAYAGDNQTREDALSPEMPETLTTAGLANHCNATSAESAEIPANPNATRDSSLR